MKKIIFYCSCALDSALMTNTSFGQTQPAPQHEPKALTDRTIGDRLQKDFSSRNPGMANQPVSWFDSGNGFYGTYSNDDQAYMTRYDKKGNYVEQ